MGHRFAEIAFTESVREVQQALGSRAGYQTMTQGEDSSHTLGARESAFISARDSFYMASVSETGWPYVQHRGGPPGFVHVVDAQTIGFADFTGNRQYISVGNLRKDNRVSLFFMDYPNRTRLKLLGRVRLVDYDESELLARLEVDHYRAPVERGFLIHVDAFDWNCPQHITPRYTKAEIEALTEPIIEQGRQPAAPRAGHQDGALGDGPLELVISGVRQLTPRVRAYELRAANGEVLPKVVAGSHLEVPVPMADGGTEIRRYSICSNPARRDIYEIAVLRDDAGTGGSRAVHVSFVIGLRLRCALPKNLFPLEDDGQPAVLIAGGIGITPIKAMAQALRAAGTPVQIHYAGRSGREMAFGDRLQREFAGSLHLYRADQGERLNVDRVLSAAPPGAPIYVCGPARLIDAVVDTARRLNFDPQRLRFERFTGAGGGQRRPLRLELRRSGKTLEVAAEQGLLDAMLEAGVDAAYGCRAGTCKACAVKVLGGEPDHRDSALSAIERTHDGLMCPCVSRATGECLVLDI